MSKDKLKKIVAREGLVFLGILAIAAIVTTISDRIGDTNCFLYGFYISFLGYPIYLLIRFVLWAIKTLGEK
jgi:hypothetical protein